ncbi:hypothetical protein SAMN05444276_101891 [Paracoccus sanguinis]|uniref:Uncharacterized protein n=1 Tax=Paracoccus sanguinis TaxID=1545044 RepID=A0A1H2TA17_9RHOB|nr:hypothetical protein SAMN05444276_101891 [Paracoccus sanguinis]
MCGKGGVPATGGAGRLQGWVLRQGPVVVCRGQGSADGAGTPPLRCARIGVAPEVIRPKGQRRRGWAAAQVTWPTRSEGNSAQIGVTTRVS